MSIERKINQSKQQRTDKCYVCVRLVSILQNGCKREGKVYSKYHSATLCDRTLFGNGKTILDNAEVLLVLDW